MKTLQSLLKFTISLGIGGLLLWLVFKDLNLKELFSRLAYVKYSWIVLSLIFSLISHLLRAYRWKLMLEPIGYHPRTSSAFWALMGGYLANLAFPRLGEVTRCALLKRTEGIAFPASFGSVIMERIIDILMLLAIIILALALQFGRISTFFTDLVFGKNQSAASSSKPVWIFIIMISLAIIMLIIWSLWGRIRNTGLYRKIRPLIGEMINGILSIKKVKNKPLFFTLTVLIWILYYLMSYVVVFSIKETSGLSPLAGLVILVAGGLGMSAPVQGGIGTYHAFVSSVLILYGITYKDGVLFATLLHTSQFIFMLIVGSISLLISIVLGRNKTRDERIAK